LKEQEIKVTGTLQIQLLSPRENAPTGMMLVFHQNATLGTMVPSVPARSLSRIAVPESLLGGFHEGAKVQGVLAISAHGEVALTDVRLAPVPAPARSQVAKAKKVEPIIPPAAAVAFYDGIRDGTEVFTVGPDAMVAQPA
jgi:hypothetical protein